MNNFIKIEISVDDFNSILKSIKSKSKIELLKNSVINNDIFYNVQNNHLKKIRDDKSQKCKDMIFNEIEKLRSIKEIDKISVYEVSKNTKLSYNTVKKYFLEFINGL